MYDVTMFVKRRKRRETPDETGRTMCVVVVVKKIAGSTS
jgi:hypothetical protein